MKEVIYTPRAPEPIGPYSQAIRANGMIFVSGQIPLIPGRNELLDGPIEEQARQVMENLKAILEAAGSSMDQVVKSGIFLSDLNDFAAVNEIYGSYFPSDAPPARATVQVGALPKGVDVEIDVIALA